MSNKTKGDFNLSTDDMMLSLIHLDNLGMPVSNIRSKKIQKLYKEVKAGRKQQLEQFKKFKTLTPKRKRKTYTLSSQVPKHTVIGRKTSKDKENLKKALEGEKENVQKVKNKLATV